MALTIKIVVEAINQLLRDRLVPSTPGSGEPLAPTCSASWLDRFCFLRFDFVEAVATSIDNLLKMIKESFVGLDFDALLRAECNIIDAVLCPQVSGIRRARINAINLQLPFTIRQPVSPDVTRIAH